jgi:hypothetical protein
MKVASQLNSLAASFEDLLTAGTLMLRPMTSAILQSKIPSSATVIPGTSGPILERKPEEMRCIELMNRAPAVSPGLNIC